MDTWHSILSRRIKPWTKVSPLSRIPPLEMKVSLSDDPNHHFRHTILFGPIHVSVIIQTRF